MTRTLPNDYARCDGATVKPGEKLPCRDCLRYTQRVTDNPRQSWMEAPQIVDGKCPKFEGEVK